MVYYIEKAFEEEDGLRYNFFTEGGGWLDFTYLNTLVEGYEKEQIVSELMQTYKTDVWDYAFSLTRNTDIADDIVQDVFLNAYEKLHTFRGESSIKTWLLKIARNRSLNWKNSAFIRKVFLAGEKIDDYRAHSVPSAEKQALENILSSEAWRLVFQLPVKHREVLVLFAQHGLNHEEIAAVLSVPVGTVKSRLHHARMKLAHAYRRGGEKE